MGACIGHERRTAIRSRAKWATAKDVEDLRHRIELLEAHNQKLFSLQEDLQALNKKVGDLDLQVSSHGTQLDWGIGIRSWE